MTLYLFRHINAILPKNHIWIIGNFDGFHTGHQSLIHKALKTAQNTNKHIGILSFTPHPRDFFNPNDNSVNIMQFSEKIHILRDLKMNYYYLHPFNSIIANMSAIDFCQKIKYQLEPSHIIVGHDFHFGKNRMGNPEFLSDFCKNNHINCAIIPPICDADGNRYASQTIRYFLSIGDIPAVKKFLSHDYILSGRVIKGKQLARKLGFPTANIALKNLFLPKFGVYKCRIVNMENRIAIANLGIKPTINNDNVPNLEIHIPNFDADLYGKKLRIAFDEFIRPEIKFDSVESLKKQIEHDIKATFL